MLFYKQRRTEELYVFTSVGCCLRVRDTALRYGKGDLLCTCWVLLSDMSLSAEFEVATE